MAIVIGDDYKERTAPCYCHYDGQTQPQRGIIELTDSGYVYVGYDSEIGGGVPFAAWHGRTRRYTVPHDLTVAGVEHVLTQIAPLLQIVYDDLSVDWDGSNWIGKLTDAGKNAELEIEQIIESGDWDRWSIWTTGDYLDTLVSPGQFCDQADSWEYVLDHSREIAGELESDANKEGIWVADDVEEYIIMFAKEQIENETIGEM